MADSKLSEAECNSVGNRASLMGSTSQDLYSKIMEFKGLWRLQPQHYDRRELVFGLHYSSYYFVISKSKLILLKDCFILKTEEISFYLMDNINQHVGIEKGKKKKQPCIFGLPQSCLQCKTACNFNIQMQAWLLHLRESYFWQFNLLKWYSFNHIIFV